MGRPMPGNNSPFHTSRQFFLCFAPFMILIQGLAIKAWVSPVTDALDSVLLIFLFASAVWAAVTPWLFSAAMRAGATTWLGIPLTSVSPDPIDCPAACRSGSRDNRRRAFVLRWRHAYLHCMVVSNLPGRRKISTTAP
jgi:hypothetical protein